jgi:hypothetical protein
MLHALNLLLDDRSSVKITGNIMAGDPINLYRLPKVRAQKCDNKVECAAGSGLL